MLIGTLFRKPTIEDAKNDGKKEAITSTFVFFLVLFQKNAPNPKINQQLQDNCQWIVLQECG